MPRSLEIIGFNIESCGIAQLAGAHRIELCDNPAEGGTTPSYGFIKAARKKLHIPLYPIIRPRGGDFLYRDEEYRIMRTDVGICKSLGCDGVVIGMLQADGTVDVERCRHLVELAYPMEVTFHRAFDRTKDPFQAMEDIISIGCERILTSGQQPHAQDGAVLIKQLIEKAAERIIIMPGSGVRSDNIVALAEKTGAIEFHSSARIRTGSMMRYMNEGLKEKLEKVSVDEAEIRNLIAALHHPIA